MKQTTFSLKYMLMTYRLDMLWLPVAFWALFLILARMIQSEPAGYPVTVAFFGAALPLIGGVLAAYAVLEDPALELQFATPRPAWWMLLERLGAILAVLAACALTYQGVLALFGIDLSPLGSLPARQLAWLVPSLAMVAMASAVAFASRQAAAGSAITGMIWIIQVIARDLFLQSPWARTLLLFMGSNYPDNPALRSNQIVLLGLSAALLLAAWLLLKRQERYL